MEAEPEEKRALRILVVDDHGVMRSGLRTLLESYPGFEVVGEAANGNAVVSQAEELGADLVLLDIQMPGLDGIGVTTALRAARPQTKVLILTAYEDDELLRAALNAGAAGYVVKRAAEAELLDAIRAVRRGEVYIHPALRVAPRAGGAGVRQLVEALTPRELEVLKLVALGHTTTQIGEQLGLSARTVEHYRANLKEKIGARTRAELTHFAVERGLLPP